MKTNKDFRWIWLINGILFLLGGICFAGLAGSLLFQEYRNRYRRQNQDTVRIETSPDATLQEEFQYGSFKKIDGSSYFVWTINSKQDYAVPVSFGQSEINLKEQKNSATRNFLFLNTADNSTHRLLSSNDFLIISSEEISKEVAKENQGNYERFPIAYFLYQIVKNDSDGDKKLTGKDLKTVSLSDASGKNLTEIFGNVEQVFGKSQIDNDTLMIHYLANGKPLVSTIKLSEYKVISTTELPNI